MLFKICLYCCTSFQTLKVQTTRSDYMQMLLILRARSRTQTPLGQDKEARKAKSWHLVCENLSEISQYTADPTHLTFDSSKKTWQMNFPSVSCDNVPLRLDQEYLHICLDLSSEGPNFYLTLSSPVHDMNIICVLYISRQVRSEWWKYIWYLG